MGYLADLAIELRSRKKILAFVSSAVPGAGKGRRPTPRVRPLRFDLPAAATPLPGKSGAHGRSGLRTRTKAAPGRDELVALPCIEHGVYR